MLYILSKVHKFALNVVLDQKVTAMQMFNIYKYRVQKQNLPVHLAVESLMASMK